MFDSTIKLATIKSIWTTWSPWSYFLKWWGTEERWFPSLKCQSFHCPLRDKDPTALFRLYVVSMQGEGRERQTQAHFSQSSIVVNDVNNWAVDRKLPWDQYFDLLLFFIHCWEVGIAHIIYLILNSRSCYVVIYRSEKALNLMEKRLKWVIKCGDRRGIDEWTLLLTLVLLAPRSWTSPHRCGQLQGCRPTN